MRSCSREKTQVSSNSRVAFVCASSSAGDDKVRAAVRAGARPPPAQRRRGRRTRGEASADQKHGELIMQRDQSVVSFVKVEIQNNKPTQINMRHFWLSSSSPPPLYM
ncbi:hypothetical protein ILYODFUR_000396 [Ilyodon furcidens]|uniref:Uncharacterized protein n=1 Tax=Ilyodon furcidens TaxID=33524 RepID=A0ABV0UZ10_9TELE